MAKTTAERQANYRNNRAMVGESGENESIRGYLPDRTWH